MSSTSCGERSSSSLEIRLLPSKLLFCLFSPFPLYHYTHTHSHINLIFTMVYPETFTGFQAQAPAKPEQLVFKKSEYTPKPFESKDIDVQISACGICGSDLHTISGGWGPQKFPLCVGHEIVGTAVRVGKDVTLVKEGQRVGVGAQMWSCLDCKQCQNDNETYCRHQVDTYGAVFPGTETVTQGGYASHIRVHEHWVFPIPEKLETKLVAPMLCAGLTAYSPLVRNGAGPGKKVGIVGLGGIGHFGLLFSVALGAETWVISRSHAKEKDAMKMGAAGFLATQDEKWNEEHKMTFDLIVNTANSMENFDMSAYLSLLDVHGKFISVGLPEGAGAPVKAQDLLGNGCMIGASHLGSRKEMLAMLDLAAEKEIRPWVEEVRIGEENIKKSMRRLSDADVRYRFCLTGFEEEFKDC